MRLPIAFSFTSFTSETVLLMRNMAQQINRLSDALQYIQQFNTGSPNKIARLLSVAATLDFPLIGVGAVATLNVTATGAAIGDYVTVCPPASLEAGLVYSGFVSAADTVTIRVLNGSGAGVDPVSASWKVLITGLA